MNIVVLFVMLCDFVQVVSWCQFPDDYFSRGKMFWIILSSGTEGKDELPLQQHRFRKYQELIFNRQNRSKITFLHRIDETRFEQDEHAYALFCLQQTDPYTYRVKKLINASRKPLYGCLAFEEVHPNIVNFRMSLFETNMEDAQCSEDHLQPLNTPMLYYFLPRGKNVFFQEEATNNGFIPFQCPLGNGGYRVVFDDIIDPENRYCVPTPDDGLARVETGCFHGSPFQFMFMPHKHSCNPVDHFRYYLSRELVFEPADHLAPLYCSRSWEQDGFEYFYILHMHNRHYAPCIRIPKQRDHTFPMWVYMDGICDMDGGLQRSQIYYQLTLTKDKAHYGFCQDIHPDCSSVMRDVHDCLPDEIELCKKSCNKCRDIHSDSPNYSFHMSSIGEWDLILDNKTRAAISISKDNSGSYRVRVGRNHYKILAQLNVTRNPVCYSFKYRSRFPNGHFYAAVYLNSTGCLPKLSIFVLQRSEPNVLRFFMTYPKYVSLYSLLQPKFGKRQYIVWEQLCQKISFKKAHVWPRQKDLIPGLNEWFTLIRRSGYKLKKCNVPKNFKKVNLIMKPTYLNCYSQVSTHDHKFILDIKNCNSSGDTYKSRKFEFNCIDSLKRITERRRGKTIWQYTLTKSAPNNHLIPNQDYLCWSFSMADDIFAENTAWLTYSGSCDYQGFQTEPLLHTPGTVIAILDLNMVSQTLSSHCGYKLCWFMIVIMICDSLISV